MSELSSHPVFLVMAIAVAATLLAEIPMGFRLPVVVLEMVFGIIVGPDVLDWASGEGLLGWLGAKAGLGALFFMAGLELDLEGVRGRPLSLALRGWGLSLGLALLAAVLLYLLKIIHAPVLVALALSTTSLGTLVPILRDSGELRTKFGHLTLAACAMGEFGPILLMSVLLTHGYQYWQEIALLIIFMAIILAAALIALRLKPPPKVVELLSRTMHSSSQLPVLLSVLLLSSLLGLSETFGFEAILGAFAGGMVVRLATRGPAGIPLREKIDAICFGFFVPFFFVTSGIKFDLSALLKSGKEMLLIPVFLILFLLVRGAPVWLYRNDIEKHDRIPFALYSATALPLVVAICDIGVRAGRMRPELAAALVGASMLSVLLFPTIAGTLRAKRPHA